MKAELAQTVWDRVLTTLWKQSRFTSYFYQFTDFTAEPAVPTLALVIRRDRFCLLYNPDFISQTRPDFLIGLLVHEMLHVILEHSHRSRADQDPRLQNLAQDMVINSFLIEHDKTFFSRRGFQENPFVVLPPGLPVTPAGFSRNPGKGALTDVSWEEVYQWLLEQQKAQPAKGEPEKGDPLDLAAALPLSLPGSDSGDMNAQNGLVFADEKGKTLPTGAHLYDSSQTNDQQQAGRKRVLRFIQQCGQCEGERLYAELAGLLTEPAPAKVSWKSLIKGLVDRTSRSTHWETSWSRFNRRYLDSGIYAPGRVYRQKPLVTVAVDVSGSMAAKPDRLEAAFGVVEDLAADYRINLLCLDQEVFTPQKKEGVFVPSKSRRPYFYHPGDWRFIRSGSKGATFFASLFNQYMHGHTEMLVVLTDGYVYDLDALKPYGRTLWVIPKERLDAFTPPFGRRVGMEEE